MWNRCNKVQLLWVPLILVLVKTKYKFHDICLSQIQSLRPKPVSLLPGDAVMGLRWGFNGSEDDEWGRGRVLSCRGIRSIQKKSFHKAKNKKPPQKLDNENNQTEMTDLKNTVQFPLKTKLDDINSSHQVTTSCLFSQKWKHALSKWITAKVCVLRPA